MVLAIGYFAGIDVTPLLQQATQPAPASRQLSAEEERAAEFTSRVLATTETVWSDIFPAQVGRPYEPPVLVLYSGVTASPCGNASGATGPFYCPADEKAYLDTAFFATLSRQLGARGDFAAAYVIAHEVAHHVQNELGVLGQVNERRQVVGETQANALTVRLELQADCLSGVWARSVDENRARTLIHVDVLWNYAAHCALVRAARCRGAARVPCTWGALQAGFRGLFGESF